MIASAVAEDMDIAEYYISSIPFLDGAGESEPKSLSEPDLGVSEGVRDSS